MFTTRSWVGFQVARENYKTLKRDEGTADLAKIVKEFVKKSTVNMMILLILLIQPFVSAFQGPMNSFSGQMSVGITCT